MGMAVFLGILGLLLGLLALALLLPMGVGAAYEEGTLRLGFKIGPWRLRLLPKKPLTEK